MYQCGFDPVEDPSGENAMPCPECLSQCFNKECGDDGCGGSCGQCLPTEVCIDHQCVTCDPDCQDKQCGGDGCGTPCGQCSADLTCSDAGLCETPTAVEAENVGGTEILPDDVGQASADTSDTGGQSSGGCSLANRHGQTPWPTLLAALALLCSLALIRRSRAKQSKAGGIHP